MPTLGDPCHSHARRRRPSIHCGYSSAEGCQCRQVMEPDTGLGVWGQDPGGRVGGQAVRCQKGQVPVVLAEVGLQGRVELGRQRTHLAERVVQGPLVHVPWALVRHALRGVFELCRRGRSDCNPWPRRHCCGYPNQGGRQRPRPLPVRRRRLPGQPDDGWRPYPRALEMVQEHMLVVIPQLGMQRCIHLYLRAQKGHQEAVQSGVAQQCIRWVASHPELRHPIFGLHGVLHGCNDLDCTPHLVHGLLFGGFCHPSPDGCLRGIRRYSARDQVLRSGLPPRVPVGGAPRWHCGGQATP